MDLLPAIFGEQHSESDGMGDESGDDLVPIPCVLYSEQLHFVL